MSLEPSRWCSVTSRRGVLKLRAYGIKEKAELELEWYVERWTRGTMTGTEVYITHPSSKLG